ncbi:ribosome maturation factor RimM [Gemmatimonadota bacterium]
MTPRRRKSSRKNSVKKVSMSAGEGQMDADGLIEIGRVAKPWGIKGEIKVSLITDVPGRFDELEGVWVHDGEEKIAYFRIEHVKHLKGAVALKLEGVDSPDSAELLRGFEVSVPEAERAVLGEGEYFIYDLIGLEVVDPEGERLGELTKVYQGSAQDIFEVATPQGARLVPVVLAYVTEIDLEHGRVVLTLPQIEEEQDTPKG